MVVGESVQGLLVAFFGDQPTRRFWDPEDQGQLDNRWETLEKSDGPPGPVVLGLRCTPSSPGDENSSQIPETIVHSCEDSAMLRMADLGEENRRAHLSEGVTESKDETTSKVDLPVGGEG